ncbi:MAG: pyruvate dehydrogenase (acetyl-transferring) E1 component subunit alpha, partial [Phaeodactylibacter sp.]|nr:pyruvate dehydrogenase (acetyl-transferring) E1 component subunit alpha [Phaeodactylibacter sp.]
SDPAKYRTKEEVQEYQERDPVKITEKMILDNKVASEAEIKAIQDKVKEEILEAVKFAEESPYPDPAELWNDNYTQADYPYIRD